MVKFYIEDDLFEIYDVDEEEFKKELRDGFTGDLDLLWNHHGKRPLRQSGC